MMTSTTTPSQVGEQQRTNLLPNDNDDDNIKQQGRHSTTTANESNSELHINFDNLCDDIVERILLHVDLASLIHFTTGTCHSFRHRLTATGGSSCRIIGCEGSVPAGTTTTTTTTGNNNGMLLWRSVFENHNFAPPPHPPPMLPPITMDYQQEIQYRLELWNNLCGITQLKKKKKKKKIIKRMEQCSKSSPLSLSSSEEGTRRRSQQQFCFSLPSSSFKFKPLLPPNMLQYPPTNDEAKTTSYAENNGNDVDDYYDDDIIMDDDDDFDTTATTTTTNNNIGLVDLPTVEFACDSYVLTSSSIGSEYVLLDPYSGSISIYDNILDNVICSDETMLEETLLTAMRKADDFIRTDSEDKDEEERSSIRSSSSSSSTRYDTPPSQTLFSVDDYFNMNLEEYFGQYTPFGTSSFALNNNSNNSLILQNGEANVDWVGVDTHISLSDDGGTNNNKVGKMVGAARTVTMESTNQTHHMGRNSAGGYEPVVTEILAWSDTSNVGDNNDDALKMNITRNTLSSSSTMTYNTKYMCRVAGEAYFMDICAKNYKVYAAFHESSGVCPFLMRDGDTSNHVASRQHQMMGIDDADDIESVANNDGESIHNSKNIYCLPLIRQHDEDTTPVKPETIASYFPMPDACITAQYAVSSFIVDSTGKTLVIGTTCGTVEVWHTGMSKTSAPPAPARIQIRSVHESFVMRHRAMTMDAATRKCDNRKCGEQKNFFDDGTETVDDLAVLDSSSTTLLHQEFPHKHPTSKIMQFYIPRHLPVQRCGFVTRQMSPQYGTTLLLWQITANDSDFHITAMINLPLLVQCHPAIHYDGRRLIIFGMDHIGLIVLVYHVLGTQYDQNEFKAAVGKGGEESGGVVQLTSERTVRFVNRIRHAFGGLEYFDSMLMTVNERFVIVNTKTGNLIGSGVGAARNATEGLLIIDLLEQSH